MSAKQGHVLEKVAKLALFCTFHASMPNCMRSLRAGLADPGPIATALWVDTELHSSVCLDSIITVVDAHNLHKQLEEGRRSGSVNEAERQIAFADTILLNKVGNTACRDCSSALSGTWRKRADSVCQLFGQKSSKKTLHACTDCWRV